MSAETGAGQHAPQGPMLFFRTMNAYQQTAALKAALELDLFTAIGERNATAELLAKRCNAAERGVRILADFLTILGFLVKNGEAYQLTPDSAMLLDRRSPACIADAARFLASQPLLEHFKDLAAVVRQGGTVQSQLGSTEPNHPMWVEFARSMAPLMQLPANLIADQLALDPAREWRILDIAAGHGVFGITLAQRAKLARVTAVDWPAVLEVARENAGKAGLTDRYETIAGSAFDVDFGSDYDLVLLTNFLHHFDSPTNIRLLRKVHAALKAGGQVATLEFVPNEDRVSPPEAAAFSLMMLGSTPAGDAYTFKELEGMLQAAGFNKNKIVSLTPSPQQLVLSRK